MQQPSLVFFVVDGCIPGGAGNPQCPELMYGITLTSIEWGGHLATKFGKVVASRLVR
jgi:hypothetical protein